MKGEPARPVRPSNPASPFHASPLASPLGQPEHWPAPLRTSIGIMLNSRHPMYVAWGPDLAVFHNSSFIPILGTRHPAEPGRPLAKLWAEIWDDIKDLIARVVAEVGLGGRISPSSSTATAIRKTPGSPSPGRGP